MRIITLIYIILLTPTFAAQFPSHVYQDRLLAGKREITRRQNDVSSALGIKEDIHGLMMVQIQDISTRLKLDPSFQDELNILLSALLPPEEILSEHRTALMAFPAIEKLSPIGHIIDLLDKFTSKWDRVATQSHNVRRTVRQIFWHQYWEDFTRSTIENLLGSQFCIESLNEAFALIRYFHKQKLQLTITDAELMLHLRTTKASIPKIVTDMNDMTRELISFFEKREEILWELLRGSQPIRTSDILNIIPESLRNIDPEVLLQHLGPIVEILSRPAARANIPVLFPLKNGFAASGASALESHWVGPTDEMPGGSFVRRLSSAFGRGENLDSQLVAFKESSQFVLHAKFIISSLKTLSKYYKAYREEYLSNLPCAYDVLTPKAKATTLYEQGVCRMTQTMGRRASCLLFNGPDCFDIIDQTGEQAPPHAWTRNHDGITYMTRRPFYAFEIGRDLTLYWLECLFGIHSEPPTVLFIDGVQCLRHNDPEEHGTLNYQSMSNLMSLQSRAPKDWHTESKLSIVQVRQNHEGKLLANLLLEIESGQKSFHQIDEHAYGMLTLFSLFSQTPFTPENLGYVERDGKFILQRIAPSELVPPIFQRSPQGTHSNIAQNILYLFPQATKKIRDSVKRAFLPTNIYYTLAQLLTQDHDLQTYLSEFVRRYNLNEKDFEFHDNDSKSFKEEISKARVFGLTTLTRAGIIPILIRHHTRICELLTRPDITYLEVLKDLRPQEYAFYQLLPDIISRKVSESSFIYIFFDDILLTLIKKAEEELEANQRAQSETTTTTSTTPPKYAKEDLKESFKAAKDCTREFQHAEIEERVFSLEETISQASEKAQRFIKEQMALYSQWAHEKSTTITFFKKIIPSILNTLQKIALRSILTSVDPPYSLDKLTLFEAEARRCLEVANADNTTSFGALLLTCSSGARCFFQKKFDWWQTESGCWEVRLISKVWNALNNDEKVPNYEDLVPTSAVDSSALWAHVPVRTNTDTSTIVNLLELSCPISAQIQDLITHTDISALPLEQSLELIDLLLKLEPRPAMCHDSWKRVAHVASTHFLALPPYVQNCLHTIGLEEVDERRVHLEAQLQKFESYEKRITQATRQESFHAATPEQKAAHFLRLLWAGFDIAPEDQNLFDAILDCLLLPELSGEVSVQEAVRDPGSIGFATNPESKGGIFRLEYKVGEHYLVPKSAKVIKHTHTAHTISAKTRLILSSHSLPLLHLYWLNALKRHCPNIQFHPWFIKTLIGKSAHLQHLLVQQLFPTFNDIISGLWPEIDFVNQHRLRTHSHNLERVLSSLTVETDRFTAFEVDGVNLDCVRGKRNMLDVLEEADELHMRSVHAAPHSLDDAATEILAHFNPTHHDIQITTLVLDLARSFNIDPQKIKRGVWSNPVLLSNLGLTRAPLGCLQLVVALRLGLPFREVILDKPDDETLMISGIRGDIPLLCELINLFPNTSRLSLRQNQIHTLKAVPLHPPVLLDPTLPKKSSLQKALMRLENLRGLNLCDNPIHNISPLSSLLVTNLLLNNTYIPSDCPLEGLRTLINPLYNFAPTILPLNGPPARAATTSPTPPSTSSSAVPRTNSLLGFLSSHKKASAASPPPSSLSDSALHHASRTPAAAAAASPSPSSSSHSPLGSVSSTSARTLSDSPSQISTLSSPQSSRSSPVMGDHATPLKKSTTPLAYVTDHVVEHTGDIKIKEGRLQSLDHAGLRSLLIDYLRLYKGVDSQITPHDIVCVLERLAELHWREIFNVFASSIPCPLIPYDELFHLIKQNNIDTRISALKLLFALKYSLPGSTIHEKLSFVDDEPTNAPDCLIRLDILGHIPKPLLSYLPNFINMTDLILTGMNRPTLLAELPRLPHLELLNLSNNGICTLQGLRVDEQDIKFPALNILIMSHNAVVSDSSVELLLELPLTLLNLKGNSLQKLPDLGNLFSTTLISLDLTENFINPDDLRDHRNVESGHIKYLYSPQRQPLKKPWSIFHP